MTTPAPYRVLVTGSRDTHDPRPVNTELDARLARLQPGQHLVIVHGACQDRWGRLRGVDAHADAWALRAKQAGHPVDVERHPAEDHGPWPACGPIRNRHMVSLGADEALAFIGPCSSPRCRKPEPHPSHGASGCADMAEQAGIPTQRRYL
ncbi:SLOG family protein [Streptomyces sp. NPDC007910]|uniref:SLOG family protein n=1 Tax=Streptomyces sp. NPDC007910 TaxID=3364790 RepID=UPI0036EAACC7